MEGAVHIAVTSRSLFDGGSERLHYDGSGTLRRSAACRENGAAIASRIRLTEEPRRAILWTLGPDGYGLPLDPAHETQARLPMGLTVTARTQMLDFSLEGPEGCINLAYTLLDRGLPLSRMQLTIRITKET